MANKNNFKITDINIMQFSSEDKERVVGLWFDYNDGWNADNIVFYDDKYLTSAVDVAGNINQEFLRSWGAKFNEIFQKDGYNGLREYLNQNNMEYIKILNKSENKYY